ncbi:hypothetical protein BH24GEM1_BH24GEM1_20530 [soil metagenome]
MRFLGLVVLLLQLQPLVGSAMCFHDAEMAKAECTMPHDRRSIESAVAPVGADLPAGCASAGHCAPSAPAVIKLAHAFQATPVVHRAPALVLASLAPGDPLPPPFHPPRA